MSVDNGSATDRSRSAQRAEIESSVDRSITDCVKGAAQE